MKNWLKPYILLVLFVALSFLGYNLTAKIETRHLKSYFQAGNCPAFSDINELTMKDNCTGLVWARTELAINKGSGLPGYTWTEANAACAALTPALMFRLPTTEELLSLMNKNCEYGVCYGLPQHFCNSKFANGVFWSVSEFKEPIAWAQDYGRSVNLFSGRSDSPVFQKTVRLNVLCIVNHPPEILEKRFTSATTAPITNGTKITGGTLLTVYNRQCNGDSDCATISSAKCNADNMCYINETKTLDRIYQCAANYYINGNSCAAVDANDPLKQKITCGGAYCKPTCGTKKCGDDGCNNGGSCGECASDQECQSGTCVCAGCGTPGTTTRCDSTTGIQTCTAAAPPTHLCPYWSATTLCGTNEVCDIPSGKCVCIPITKETACVGKECGSVDNGCGTGTFDCGSCLSGKWCNGNSCETCGPSDNAHCGSTCESCTGSKTCTSGTCSCPTGQKDCSGTCIPTANCCPSCAGPNNKVCIGGTACGCNIDSDCASGNWCDTTSHTCSLCNTTAHCGTTTCVSCTGGKTCTSGTCGCATGYKDCSGTCILNANCCTSAECTAISGQTCQSGTCACPTGQKVCGTSCIPTANCCTDPDCSTNTNGHKCISGTCGCSLTTDCPTGKNCTGGTCVISNSPPTVALITPINGSTFTAPVSGYVVEANATDIDGTITKVQFYQNGTYVSEDTTAPSWRASFSTTTAGSYCFYAIATDDDGATATSPTNCITVIAPKYVFVTTGYWDGNVGGITGADQKCNSTSEIGGTILAGKTFKAWVSNQFNETPKHSPALDFTHSAAAYKLVDGTLVANNWTDLVKGNIAHKINITAKNVQVPTGDQHQYVWTNTDYTGNGNTDSSDTSCWDLTSAGTGWASVGDSDSAGYTWTGNLHNQVSPQEDCVGTWYKARLYCFEQ